MLEEKDKGSKSEESSDTGQSIAFIPLEVELENPDQAVNLMRKIKKNLTQGNAPLSDEELEEIVDKGNISLHSFTGDAEETLVNITNATGQAPSESIIRAANCCDVLKKIGTEILIYSLSFGGFGVVTGLFMRFAHTDRLASMLIGNGIAVLANENARAYFTRLINPHGESVPEDKKEMHDTIKKYLAHPISTIITSTINGGTVALTGATDLGTRQILVSITAQLGGITTYIGQSLVRKSFGGSIVIKPREKSAKQTMVDFYSRKPNPNDGNRPEILGRSRDIITRIVGMSLATTTTWFAGLYDLETYCGAGKEELLQYNGTFTVNELNDYCDGGQFTILFRDWGVTAVGLIGFLVVQPTLNWLSNKIFDYFFPPQSDTGHTPLVEEVVDDEEEDKTEAADDSSDDEENPLRDKRSDD